MTLRVGIFFGGSAREQEVSFAGGRSVYDLLDRALFVPIPIFVTPQHHCVLLDWQHIYKGSIVDFFHLPTVEALPSYLVDEELAIQDIGTPIAMDELDQYIDIAFINLHGPRGEDGTLQGVLAWQNIPYTGAGIAASGLCLNKVAQRQIMQAAGMPLPRAVVVERAQWLQESDQVVAHIQQNLKVVVTKPANEGSSIGVRVVEAQDTNALKQAIDRAFFILRIDAWETQSDPLVYLQRLCDARHGLGLPLWIEENYFTSAAQLQQFLEAHPKQAHVLIGDCGESQVLVEDRMLGREFSCILIEDHQGKLLVLPPTEIKQTDAHYDYRAKYLAGTHRKITPMTLSTAEFETLSTACKRLYRLLNCSVYARIDGFYTNTGEFILNDPNTSSGLLPSSFFFHQGAEIGLTPTRLLTHVIYRSLEVRIKESKSPNGYAHYLHQLDQSIKQTQCQGVKTRVAVLTGGYSSEKHIAIESARNIYAKLAASKTYEPTSYFLMSGAKPLHTVPLAVLLKDHAHDIQSRLEGQTMPVYFAKLYDQAAGLRARYGEQRLQKTAIDYETLAQRTDVVFIAMHGRPGEDGTIQQALEQVGLPYNGSGVAASQLAINKYLTAQTLRKAGLLVPEQQLIAREAWTENRQQVIDNLQALGNYPYIAKPVDDGCSTSVKRLDDQAALEAYLCASFREKEPIDAATASALGLATTEPFPQQACVLLESCVTAQGAMRLLEITAGLITHGAEYEVFPFSEVLTQGGVLSLEEKFLAGEGQNITPARLAKDPSKQQQIQQQIQTQIAQAARILGLQGYARIDAFVRIYAERVEVIFIEANTLPGMTPATCLFHQAAQADYTPYSLIAHIIQEGYDNKKN